MNSLATPEAANRATFTDINGGDILTVATYGDANVLVRFDRGPQGQSDLAGIIVSADQAPAVALAILTAAGLIKPAGVVAEDTTQGHRRQTIDGEYFSANSDSQFWVDSTADELEDLIRKAQNLVNRIAVRDYFADETARATEAAAKELTRRRDELAIELVPTYAYAGTSSPVQRAIDMIIQLQDEAAK